MGHVKASGREDIMLPLVSRELRRRLDVRSTSTPRPGRWLNPADFSSPVKRDRWRCEHRALALRRWHTRRSEGETHGGDEIRCLAALERPWSFNANQASSGVAWLDLPHTYLCAFWWLGREDSRLEASSRNSASIAPPPAAGQLFFSSRRVRVSGCQSASANVRYTYSLLRSNRR